MTKLTLYNTLFTLDPACGLLPTGNETARPFYGGITYILYYYKHNQLQVTNIEGFPLCLASFGTYSINSRTLSGYYPKSGYSPGLSGQHPKLGHSRTVRPTSEAGTLPNFLANIRSWATPKLFGQHLKLGHSRTVRPTSEAGLLPGYSRTIRLISEARLFSDYPATIRSRASPGLSG